MPLRRLRITALRCIEAAELALDPSRNYIYGANGAGKSSVLEAIFLLGRGRSFRTRRTRALVRHGQEALTVYGEVDDSVRTRRLGATFGGGHLDRRLDGERAKGSAVAEILPVHAIGPDSHDLIEGGPIGRRRLIDWGVFHVERAYLEAWQRYRRLLGQRNTALKTGGTGARQLGVWTTALTEAGEEIDRFRSDYVDRLAASVAEHARALLGIDVTVDYHRGWPAGITLADALAASEARDRLSGHTEVGPHRADVTLQVDGHEVRNVASRGQQKLVAAALILAQETVLAVARGTRGVLLVDDPAAELDGGAVDRLLDRLAGVQSQVVFTGLTPRGLPARLSSALFHVEHGRVVAL